MAVFNPDYKEVGLQDYRESRPISQMEGDKSAGILLEGAGKLISSAASAGDQIIKANIREDANKVYDMRQDRIDELERASNSMQPVQFASVQNPTTYDETIDLDTRDQPLSLAGVGRLPSQLAELPNRAQALETARASGKISNTHFYSLVNEYARELRARYGPGYYQYVDNAISNVIGVDPANAQMASLLGDINAYVSSTRAAKDATRKDIIQAVEKGIPDADKLLQYWDAGVIPDHSVYSYINAWTRRQFEHEDFKRQRERISEGDKEVQRVAEMHANRIASDEANLAMQRISLRQGFPSGKTLFEAAQEARAGRLQLTPEMKINMAAAVEGIISETRLRIKDKFNQRGKDDPNRYLSRDLADTKKEKDIIDNALVDLKELRNAFADGDLSLARIPARKSEAITNQAGYEIFNTAGEWRNVALAGAAFSSLPKEVQGIYAQKLLDSRVATLQAEVETLVTHLGKTALTQPTQIVNEEGIRTMLDNINKVEKVGFKSPEVYQELTSFIDDNKVGLTSKEMAKPENKKIRENLADHIFHPKGWALLDKFVLEGEKTDPATGQPAQFGKYSLYRRLSSEQMVLTMKEIGGERWKNYQSYMKHAFGNQLFKAELAEFNKYAADAEGIRFFWNTSELKFSILPPIGGMGTNVAITQATMSRAQAMVDRLNDGVAGLANVAHYSGQDVEAYLIRVMKDYELNLIGPGIILPQKLRSTLEGEYKKLKAEEEEKAKKAREGYTK